MTDAPSRSDRHRRHRRRSTRGRRRWVLAGAGLVVLLLVGAAAALAAFRYLPALDEARALKTDLETMVTQAKAAGLGLDRTELNALKQDDRSARDHFASLDALLTGDPLVALARVLPPTRDAVVGADHVAQAGGALLDAADAGLSLADRYVTIKEQAAAAGTQGQGSALAQLTELMATGQADVNRAVAAIDQAQTALEAAPAKLPGPIASIRDLMVQRIADYGPVLHAYAELQGTLPGILGWDSPKRYLVLTQDPAELRPTGGFIGSFGTITFDKGHITERHFQDVFLLDLPWDYPFVTAPPALSHYLLGPKQPWQLADANWSPDFPTSAQEAVTLYRNEGGAGPIDGVLGLTTYTIDDLLSVTGPVTVPDYGVTIASGETTLKVLQNTRVATTPDTNRKAFLSDFADRLFTALLALPPARWTDLASHGDRFSAQHLLLAWFADPGAEGQMTKLGFGGAVRQDPGDFMYPVDANVSPVSKLNAVTDRSLDIAVKLDQYGNADDTLTAHWDNQIMTDAGKAYRALPTLQKLTTLGMYFRLYVPQRSRLEAVSAGTQIPITAPADMTDELGRTVIANYFQIPPGAATLMYRWVSPYPADLADNGIATYRLTVQKEPGLRPGPLHLQITLPPGATFVDASPGLTLSGGVATVDATFDRDLVAVIRYRPAAGTP